MKMIGFAVMGCFLLACKSEVQAGIKPLKRGVNLSHWFSQANMKEDRPGVVGERDMQLIASVGFDHVRLPVDPTWLWRFPDEGPLQAAMLQELDAAIQLALDHGLNVVVDMHPNPKFKEFLQSNELVFNSFLLFWKEFAGHLSKYDADRVALEIINEPMVNQPEHWQGMVNELHAAIRSAAPKHTIVIGGGEWSDVEAMCRLVPVADTNVVYTFHFYEPHVFTHQGARWGEPEWGALKKIPYPLDGEEGVKILRGITDADARKALEDHIAAQWNADKIGQKLDSAVAWAKEHGATLWCGEFGVFSDYADPKDRARYIRDVRTAFEERGIGWTMWDYRGGFSLIKDGFGRPKVDAPIGKALGLPKGK